MSHTTLSPSIDPRVEPPVRSIANAHSPRSYIEEQLTEEKINRIHIKILPEQLPRGCKANDRRRRLVIKTIASDKRYRNLDEGQRDLLEEQEKKKKALQQRKNNILMNRMKRQTYLEEMKQINKNYSQFMREFRSTKPYYQVKEEEFQYKESLDFQVRRQRALIRLKEVYKPLNIEEIMEHQKRYLQSKMTIDNPAPCNPEEVAVETALNKRYSREKLEEPDVQQIRELRERFKQKESEEVAKMKQHCENVLNKAKDEAVDCQSKKRERSFTEPVQLSNDETKQKKLAHLRLASNCKNLKVSELSQPSPVSSQVETVQSSPKRRFLRPRVIKDRYEIRKISEWERGEEGLVQGEGQNGKSQQAQICIGIEAQQSGPNCIEGRIKLVHTHC